MKTRLLLPILIVLYLSNPILGERTLYSHRDVHVLKGDWHNDRTWTTVFNGGEIVNPTVAPANGDRLIITENTTVQLNQNVTTTGLHIEVRAGATLIIGAHQFTNSLASLTGQGTLVINHYYYPLVSGSHTFAQAGGGTLVYNLGSTGTLPTLLTQANNLQIIKTAASDITLTLAADLAIAGNLSIEKQDPATPTVFTFRVGNNTTVRHLNVARDLLIGRGVEFRVGYFNASHAINLDGNLRVDGILDLTNSAQYQLATNGAATVRFRGVTNTSVTGTGPVLDFYRLILDKGSDQTFELDILHPHLQLYFPTNRSNAGADPNPVIQKALWIRNGTLILREGIMIPELSSGGSDFFIPANGKLWIAGAVVHSTLSTRPMISNAGVTVIGTLRVSSGVLRTNNSAGIGYRGQARIFLEGGEVTISQFRPSLLTGSPQVSWTQSGGVVTVDGVGESNVGHPRFSLPMATHSFTMTGGTLNVSSPLGSNRGMVIGSDAGNTKVTGGVVNITIPNDMNFGLSSTAPFFQLNVLKSGTTARDLIITSVTHDFGTNSAQPLTVLSHLNLQANARLNANGNNVNIGGNFTLAVGARYITGANTTRFFWHTSHGNSPTTVTINDPALLWPLDLHHLVFDKNMPNTTGAAPGKDIDFVSTGRVTTDDRRFLIRTAGNITHNVRQSRINLNGYGIHARGNITIEDHNVEGAIAWVNTSVLRLGGSAQQLLAVRGWHGLGPNRIILDNTAGARLLEDADLGNGIVEFTNGILDIGSNLLSTNNPVVLTSGSFNVNRMIQTSGLIGDRGVRLVLRNVSVAGSAIFNFPIGTPGKYTPLRLTITGTGSFSDHDHHITIKPVNRDHPLVRSVNNVLRYYWITEARIAPGGTISPSLTFDYYFTYHSGDAHNINGSYRSMLLREGLITWEEFPTFNETARTLTFAGLGFISADYTAGQNNEFQSGGRSPIFYSRVSGAWENNNTWSRTGHTGDPAGTTPGSTAIVIIATGHTVTTGTDGRAAQSLRIDRVGSSSGVLDLEGTNGHNFPTVLGGGILRLSTGTLPRVAVGNYSNIAPFHFSDGGTIEFYGTNPIDLPIDKLTYNNLLITGAGIKTLPSGTININGQLTIRDRGVLRTSPTGVGTLNLHGLFFFDRTGANGTNRNRFLLSREHAWTININGEMRFQEWGEISVATTGSGSPTHTINLTGSITEGRGAKDLWETASNNTNLFVRSGANIDFGTGDHGGTWELNRLILDMENAHNTLTIQRHIVLRAPTTGTEKALELRRGILVLGQSASHPNIKDITLSSDATPFHIPLNTGLVVEGSNIVRTTVSTNIDLDGLLEFRGNARGLFGYTGTEATSPGTVTSNIIYGTTGSSRFEVHGNAVVHVSGQVRRSEFTTYGVLRYRQTGNSTVVVGTGNPATASKGVFEVLNAGSEFFLDQNAHLIIAEAADNSQPALLLMPASGQVLGTITLGHAFTGTDEQFGIRCTVPLFHLNVHGHNSPVAYIYTLPLFLSGNKSIATGGRFESRGLGYELKGNLTNNGVFVSQTTEIATFSGNQQTVSGTGTTTFNNWRIDAIVGVDLNKNVLVANDLNILRGAFRDNGNIVTVKRHLTNNGVHVSDLNRGGIVLGGTASQEIRGLGYFGRLEVNHTQPGIEVVAFSPLNISNALLMTNGILNIGSHRLTLNENVGIAIPSGQSFSTARMVRTGGGMGDGGIRKFFDSGEVPGTFTFPLGTGSKYTPAVVELNNFPRGHHITVYNVNSAHPAIVPAAGGDPDKVLQYYWGVESNIGTTNISATISFVYDIADIRGNLANYFTTQLQPCMNDTWARHPGNCDPMTIIPEERRIIFVHHNKNSSVFCGFYTAGEQAAIPDRVARFVAQNSGRWESPGTWASGIVPHFGVVAEIPHGVSIRIDEHMKRAYRTVINGHLSINPATAFHNLGIVEGSGTLEIEGTGEVNPMNLPAGRFDQFTACNNPSTIMFSGAGGRLPINIIQYHNLIITGSGTKSFPAASNIFICGNFDIRQNVTAESRANQVFNISGNVRKESAAQIRSNFTGNQFIMQGGMPQVIDGNFTGNNSLCRLTANNPTHITIRGAGLEISERLFFDSGIIRNENSVIRLLNPIPEAVSNQSTTRFIEGSLTRVLPASCSLYYEFPVAKIGRARFVSLQNTTSSGNREWTVEYYNADPGNNGMPRTLLYAGHQLRISPVEYWRVRGPSPGSANVTLNWGPESMVSIVPSDLEAMVVAEWTPSGWSNRGMQHNSVSVGAGGFGKIASGNVTFSEKYFTLASTTLTNPLPIELVSFNGRAEDGAIILEWVTASETNNNFFTIERSFDGRNFEIIGYVDSKAPGGFSNELLHYLLKDQNPPDGIIYYRLKQTDYDGAYEYSDDIAVFYRSLITDGVCIAFHPNPTNGESFNVLVSGMAFNENVILQITDMFGKSVMQQNLTADSNGNVVERIAKQAKLPPGVYIVTVTGVMGRASGRLVVK